MTKEVELKTFEISLRGENNNSTFEVTGAKLEFEPQNETYVLIKIYDENNSPFWWYLTEHPVLCRVIEKTTIHKVIKNKNVLHIEDQSKG